MTLTASDTPDWALREYEAHERQRDAALCRIDRDDRWLRLMETRIACPLDSTFARWYAATLDASMEKLDAEREAEGR
jgi:hypothetical protein